ncbi:sel1 repeat family protein [Pseudomonas sp. LS44]|uniref:tetratricopeptide repeat protein n=1 Tax=Pseudomonas sp. LS44 TaxID=1357074 RepID=UPI00215AE8E8|nr:sel1 repeat family protein [Pseudomonas sp. LS44]UVE19756.1 sel1 repeat family protein [Pseudomonas sp. LS44]
MADMWLWQLRARLGYWCARRLMRWAWLVRQPRAWQWMQGQFSRLAALGDQSAQSFYGHLLIFRGQGFGSREEGIRLLRQAATAGDGKAAYQLGVLSLAGDSRQAPDGREAARWWVLASNAGHPLASRRLAELYRTGGAGLPADTQQADRYAALASERGL